MGEDRACCDVVPVDGTPGAVRDATPARRSDEAGLLRGADAPRGDTVIAVASRRARQRYDALLRRLGD